MRAVIQRVKSASVDVDGRVVGKIQAGLLVLLGVGDEDEDKDVDLLAQKTATLRIFADDDDKMNRSVEDIRGSVLVVSQFTLYGDCRKGRRPSFAQAAPPAKAETLYRRFIKILRDRRIPVAEGCFGASMEISLINDGPVTILIDSKGNF